MATAALSEERPRVLVVEDEFIIALDLSETVKDLGYALEGPFADKKTAFSALGRGLPDCAILDVFTKDGEVFPLADALTEAGVPIIFHSGHVDAEEMRKRYPRAIACNKPCPPDHMIDMLQAALDQAKSSH
ncbi:DNA-binding NtrC family response regulator [Altererythrobacter atlanticus]|uniref:Two-component response regulator n=1 Tax=Croceibacterium atlanticum TaxID=1267766 RepID=A0A0F7KYC3_9SPHN|nr:response regulator [Croceibacterium atlanticum]AKH44246.1 two-component response regulator [Croceibacterium atlanticum]MBB5732557.1 DNA-binding NtrC family response regulator [Croceibacterium atlanticum]